MSKFLKLLEQVDPKNTDKQEMIHKLAELFNLISSVEVSSDGDSITVNVDGEPIKLSVVEENEEDNESTSYPSYSIDAAVQGLAQKPLDTPGAKKSDITKAQKAVQKRDNSAGKAITKYEELTQKLEDAITAYDASGGGFNVTQ